MVKVPAQAGISPVPYHTLNVGPVEGVGETVEEAAQDAGVKLSLALGKVYEALIEDLVHSSEMSERLKKGGKAIISRGKDGTINVEVR